LGRELSPPKRIKGGTAALIGTKHAKANKTRGYKNASHGQTSLPPNKKDSFLIRQFTVTTLAKTIVLKGK